MKYLYIVLLFVLGACRKEAGNTVLWVAVAGLLFGCTSRPLGSIETIEIAEVKHSASTEPAFKTFEFVKLETTPESLLPDVAKVLVHKDRIYALSMIDTRVFIFSSDGKYINSLKKGQGPGEVFFVSDMDIHNDELYVLDRYRTIRKYDLDGHFICDVSSFDSPRFSMKHVGDDLLLFDPYVDKTSDFLLHQLNDKGDKGWFAKKETLREANMLNYNFYNDGYVSWPMCDTIYRYDVSSSLIQPKFVVRFLGKSFYDIIDDEEYTNEKMYEINTGTTYYRWLKDVAPYGSGIFFAFRYDQTYFVRYEGGHASVYSTFVETLPQVRTASVGHSKDQMIYAFTADQLLENKEEALQKAGADGQVASLYESLSEDDNPVLIFVSLKD